MNPEVSAYLAKLKQWPEELEKLRTILLECGLTEEFKWRAPCYTYHQKNVILIGGFKDYFVLSFIKGVLLNDPYKILVSPGKNSQSTKMFKFTHIDEIEKQKAIIQAYIFEAIEVEKAGLKVKLTENQNLIFPEELLQKFEEDTEFKAAFKALTPGRQRAYNMFFTAPKQSKTIVSRIEKYRDRILIGKGINDCVCGLSKRLPNCDGSHKYIK